MSEAAFVAGQLNEWRGSLVEHDRLVQLTASREAWATAAVNEYERGVRDSLDVAMKVLQSSWEGNDVKRAIEGQLLNQKQPTHGV